MKMDKDMSLSRELNGLEICLEVEQKLGKFINPRCFLINCDFDLFYDKNIVLKGINEWKQLHPLLQSNICIKDSQYYFSRSNQSTENIQFVRYKDYAGRNELKNCWKFLYENEFTQPFDSENELLWRLSFIELESYKESFHYCVLFTVHHAITGNFEISQEQF